MILGLYKDYISYVLEHKKNVFKTCWEKGLYIHAFTHDLSKFSRSEFKPYVDWFSGEYGVKFEENFKDPDELAKLLHKEKEEAFKLAWQHHYEHNKHHWKHWCYDWDEYYSNIVELNDCELSVPKKMPERYINQMICDWEAMSIKFGGTAQKYYMTNYYKIKLHPTTRWVLENKLGLIPRAMYYEQEYWQTIGDIYENIIDKYEKDPTTTTEPEEYMSLLFNYVNEEFDINVYDMMRDAYDNKEI